MSVELPERRSEVHLKGAHIAEAESFVIRVATGFYDNTLLGLPSGGGTMLVFSAHTGKPEAPLLDNGCLTDLQTAAARLLPPGTWPSRSWMPWGWRVLEPTEARDNGHNVVSKSDLLVTATPPAEPYVRAGWLRPGLHITAVGADSPDKQELDSAALAEADLLARDLKSQRLK